MAVRVFSDFCCVVVLAACGELQDFFATCRDGSVRLMKIGIIEGLGLLSCVL